jgi:hypothetical protein
MKRLLLCVCMFLAGATSLQDEVITSYTGPVSFSTTVDSTSSSTYDIVTIVISGIATSLTGTDYSSTSSGKVDLISGEWSVTGTSATGFLLDSSSTDDTVSGAAYSYMNFANNTATLWDGKTSSFTAAASGDSSVYSAFADSWYASKTTKYLAVNATLASLYVTKGWTSISFSDASTSNGSYITVNTLGYATETITITQTAVPEPGAFSLLVAGLFGLVAYARRKRKQ